MGHRICNTVEAKAKLNELLEEVCRGREIVISRRGKVVAKLIPAGKESLDDREQTIRVMKNLRDFQKRLRETRGSESLTVQLLRELRRES